MAVQEESGPSPLDTAVSGIDEALQRLERGVRGAAERLDGLDAIEREVKRLANDRVQLANALERMTVRANRLDQTAEEVSKRLIAAMEKVRAALSKEEG